MEWDQLETITFDLDGTLLEYERSPGEVLGQSYENLGIDPIFPVEEYYARYDEFASRYDSLDRAREECFAAIATDRGADPAQGRAVAEAFAAERDQSRVEPLPGAERILEAVSDQYRTAIITNGAADAQRAKITALGFDERVETVVVAGATCPPKPAPEPFERAVDSLGTDTAETVHVGDSLGTDIAGANAAGLRSVWIGESTGSADAEPTETVESLVELCTLLEPRENEQAQ